MADTTKLAALRVTAEMDASGFTAGAAEIDAAAKKAGTAAKGLGDALNQAGDAAQQVDTRLRPANDGLERLQRQFIDGYGAAQNLERALNTISRAMDRGAISAERAATMATNAVRRYGAFNDAAQFAAKGQVEFAAAIEKANASLGRQAGMRPGAANQNMMGGGQQFAAQNVMYQLQDIGVTAAMGMSPLMIAMQQGTQISAALGPMGAAGAVEALKGAFIGLVNPVSLVTIGLVAAGAAAIQYLMPLFTQGADATKELEKHRQAIDDIAKKWGEVAPAFKAYADERERLAEIEKIGGATRVAADDQWTNLKEQIVDVNIAMSDYFQQAATANSESIELREAQSAWSKLRSEIESGKATSESARAAQRELLDLFIETGIPGIKEQADTFGTLAEAITKSSDAAAKLNEQGRLLELNLKFTAGIANSTLPGIDPLGAFDADRAQTDRANATPSQADVAAGTGMPIPEARPNIELEGDGKELGSKSNIVEQIKSRQALTQALQDQMDMLNVEARALGLSSRERGVMVAALQAEQALRRLGISALSDEGRAYIANAQAAAALRAEITRQSQLAVSRDPSGAKSNIAAQIQAREALWQTQRDEMAMLDAEGKAIGASTKERAMLMAAIQAEQSLRKQGIDTLSEEGRAYIANAEAMAGARVEIERRNQLALSRDPAGSRADIAGQVQARQQLFQGQQDEIEKLRLEAQLVGANAQTRATMTAALEAEQRLRQSGIDLLSREGQAYVANAQAMAQARLEIERQNAAYASLQSAGGSAIDSLTVGTGSLQDRLKAAADTMLQWIQQLAIANPLKNALFGSNLPTIADLGKPATAIPGMSTTSTATMTVTAGVVNVAGGGFPSIPGTSTPGTTSGSLLDVIKGTPTNGVRPDLMAAGIVNSPVSQTAPTGNIEDYIRQSAITRGIDPDVAVRVAQSEGGLKSWNMQSLATRNGIQEPSYGPFQLLKGGQGTGYPTGLGNDFVNKTGLDPALAANGPQGVDFALDHASKNGWGAWYGADKAGISKWEGIGPKPAIDPMTTNSTTNAVKQLSTSAAAASKDITGLGDSTSKLTTSLTDNLGKLATPSATPAIPAVAPTATAPAGGNIFSSLFGGIFKLFGFADGTDFAPGGVAMVGERGPELVNLPRGSQVVPNHKLGMGGKPQAGSRSARFEYNITVGGNGDRELMERMRLVAEDSVGRGIRTFNDEVLPGRVQDVAMHPDYVG